MLECREIIKISALEALELYGLSSFHGLSLIPFGTLRIGEKVRFW